MRTGNPTGFIHRKSLSVVAVHEITSGITLKPPASQRRDSVASAYLSIPVMSSRRPSNYGLNSSRCSSVMRGGGTVIGIVSGETSKHFLVKAGSSWIPVLKTAFFNSAGENLALVLFGDIKNKKVKLYHSESQVPEAQLLEEGEVIRTEQELFGDRIHDYETDAGFSEEDNSKALEAHVALSQELLTDVVAMAALGPDPARSQQYFRQRAPRLRKSLDAAMATLKDSHTDLYEEVHPGCSQLMANVEMLTRETTTGCGRCKVAHSRVTLSCAHQLCLECAKTLVNFPSGTEFKLQRCPLCHRELTLTDSRLILLEKYEALKKGMKYVNAIGIDLSRLRPPS